MKKRSLFMAVLILFLLSPILPETGHSQDLARHWAWMYMRGNQTDQQWEKDFRRMRKAGVGGVLMLIRDRDMERFAEVMRIGREAGLSMHVWIPVTNPHGSRDLGREHPEWFMVSRNGESSLDKPPYIPSYRWLCPNQAGVTGYLVEEMRNLARLDYLDGVHLDYIRFPDVILPVGIQPKYDLVQDKEYPEFDFCYCDSCRAKFRRLTGTDPMDLEDPAADARWLRFRYRTITGLVNEIATAVHEEGKLLTAAVFPTPDLARKLVRQEWEKWNLDMIMPMIYHEYYNEPLGWIEDATRQGVEVLDGRMDYFSGLFVGWIPPGDFEQAMQFARRGGADGICLFNANMMTRKQWRAMAKANARL